MKKILAVIFTVILFAGGFLLIGTAGASDRNMITEPRMAIYVLISFALIGVGMLGMHLTYDKE